MISRARGFTLIEVLVAFVILALALSVLTRILSLASHSLASAGHYQQALYLAESQLAEIGATLRARRSEHLKGRLEPPYRWEAELEPYDFVSSQLNLEGRIKAMLITVSVSWGDNPGQRVSLSTIRLVEEPL